MKAIDFTKPGGFPLTQNQLDYLQQAYTESIKALGAMGINGSAPVIISGMTKTVSGGTTTISGGWFYYNGDMVRFPGASYGGIMLGYAVYMVVSSSTGTLIFNDGSTPGVVLEKTGVLTLLVNTTPTDSTHFLVSDMVPFGKGFGMSSREQVWHELIVNTDPADGGVTGSIYYKKDFTANTLQIRGALFANNAQNFSASPGALFALMGTLPTGFLPNNNAQFIAHYFVSGLLKDDLGIGWIKQFTCGLNNTGQIFINWIRPDIAISGYGVNFNTIIPLD